MRLPGNWRRTWKGRGSPQIYIYTPLKALDDFRTMDIQGESPRGSVGNINWEGLKRLISSNLSSWEDRVWNSIAAKLEELSKQLGLSIETS